MQSEDGCREPRPGDTQPHQDESQHDSAARVQDDVNQMVAELRVCPEFVLQPKSGEEHRIVLLGGPRLNPNPLQALKRTQVWPRHMSVIVPNRPPIPRGFISH